MKRAEIERKFDEIVDFSGVEKFIDTPVKHYSSGMYVRLAFAVAAHLEPEILLVDEVLAVGDAAFQKKCLGKMGDVAREERTVLRVQAGEDGGPSRELRDEGQFQPFRAQGVRWRHYASVCLGALEQCLCLVNSAGDRVNDITGDLCWHVLCAALGAYHGRDASHGSVHALSLELDTDETEFGFRPTLVTDGDQPFHLRSFLFRLRRVGVSHSSSEGT
jgi:hypothetical protein